MLPSNDAEFRVTSLHLLALIVVNSRKRKLAPSGGDLSVRQ